MTKNALICFLVSLCCYSVVNGQLLLNFPDPLETYDEIMVLRDYDPTLDVIEERGHNLKWDISAMKAPALRPQIYTPSNAVQQSFDYTFAIKDDHGIQRFYKRKVTNIDLIYQEGLKLGHVVLPVAIRYTTYPTDFYLRLDANAKTSYSYSGEGEFTLKEVPSALRPAWGAYGSERFRISFDVDRSVLRGSSGKLQYLSFEDWTLREDVSETWEIKLYIWKESSWVLVDDAYIKALPKEKKYTRFFAKDHFYPIAVIEHGEEEKADWIEYNVRRHLELFNVDRSYNGSEVLTVYPNPAYGFVRFQFENFPPDTYTISIRNIFGQEIQSYDMEIEESDAHTIPLYRIPKGTYLYSVKDSKNVLLTTRRLIVLDP